MSSSGVEFGVGCLLKVFRFASINFRRPSIKFSSRSESLSILCDKMGDVIELLKQLASDDKAHTPAEKEENTEAS